MARSLAPFLELVRRRTEGALNRLLPSESAAPERLHQAMRYSVFAGGKRIRPAFVHAAAELGEAPPATVDDFAAALELVHTYSLIHDDLPAMDDDELRRGKPTCHVQYDEATAILAGDALLTLAFEAVAGSVDDAAASASRVQAARHLARGAGAAGMVGGQMADLEAERAPEAPSDGEREATLTFIHSRKTGGLLSAAAALGGLAAALDGDDVDRLAAFGGRIGLAFQIADDLLDVEADASQLGKAAQKDSARGKLTYPAVHGLAGARRRAGEVIAEADELLAPFGADAARLRDLARYVVERRS